MKLLLYPDKSLETICTEVKDFNEDLWNKLDHMKEIMQKHDGMGLAANQIGLTERMFIMKDLKGKIWEFINPVIVFEDDIQYDEEGCLSFPGAIVNIQRAKQVTILAKDRIGFPINAGAIDREAICIQHEMEHLNGITFLNKLSRQQRREVLRSMKK